MNTEVMITCAVTGGGAGRPGWGRRVIWIAVTPPARPSGR